VSRTHIKQRITNRKFDDPFKLGLMVKDIDIAMRLASDMGLTLPLSQQNQEMWGDARKLEGDGQSVSNLVRWLERQTGVDITPGNAV
jgi:3-hydroxyisobutyrate dehydrogenase-like beta-hydroxyacid dehydrogenase